MDSDPVMRLKTHELELPVSAADQKLIDRMVEYIDESFDGSNQDIRPGIAIAGNQVGLEKNVIYIHFFDGRDEHKYLLANPKITSYSAQFSCLTQGEGCLSVEQMHEGIVKRHYAIVVKAYDLLNKKEIEIHARDILSICMQHEIDHLFGKFYYDHIDKKNPMFIGED
jgi:peptide deformylase